MSTESAPAQIRSIERAAAILRLLSGSSSRGLGVAELAKELCLPRGTVHSILRTLRRERFVEQDTESSKYRLGETLLPMGFRYLEANALRVAALSGAHVLATRTGESVRVGTLYESRVLIVHHVLRPDNSLQLLDIGSLAPLHATALGKALLTVERDLLPQLGAQGMPRFTTATRTDLGSLRREVAQASTRGWAVELGELSPRVASIAAPIPAGRFAKPAAIAIDGATERLFEDGIARPDLLAAVIESARDVSHRLAASRWSM